MLVVTAAISFVGASGDFLGEWQKLYQKTTAMAVDGNRKRVQYEWQTARRISNHSRISQSYSLGGVNGAETGGLMPGRVRSPLVQS